MQHNQSISRYKQKLLLFLSALFIALTLQPKQEVHAEPDNTNYTSWASSLVHSTGDSNQGGTDYIPNGVSYTRTGYLAYLLTADGAPVTGTSAVAFSSPGFAYLDGYSWYATARKGGYTATSFAGGTAPWNCTPWQSGGSPTNEPVIKEYFQTMDDSNNQRGIQFVYRHWGVDAARMFRDNNYIIVIETLMHFQYSSRAEGADNSSASLSALATNIINAAYGVRGSETESQLRALIATAQNFGYGFNYDTFIHMPGYTVTLEAMRSKLHAALVQELSQTLEGSGRQFTSPPLIGTPANLLTYKNNHSEVTSNPFSSYTNKVAPFSERAIADGVAERAGFNVWTGSTSSQISDADVMNYGVAMMIITANSPGQTTCDESLQPTPHNPPKESTGHTTIVKSYRTKDPAGKLIDDGTYSTPDLGTQILIENEQTYQVIGWKTSTTTNTNISSLSWESSVPSSVVQQGTTPKSVTLDPQETCLYVLLEKIESEPEEPLDWNYRLTESSITRTVWFSNPDNPLTNMNSPYIQDHPFQWTAVAHQECPGHTYYGPCQTTHDAPCDCSGLCPSNCKAKETDPTHVCVQCTKSHKSNCGSRDCPDNKLTAYCKGWQWKEKQLFLSINNTLQNSYPDILATKEGWNSEVREGGIIKHYYRNDSKFDRLSKSTQTYTDNGWDYVCILMRGKDKLTLAEWENYGEGNNAGNA